MKVEGIAPEVVEEFERGLDAEFAAWRLALARHMTALDTKNAASSGGNRGNSRVTPEEV